MTRHDIFNATIRHPKYLAEWAKLGKLLDKQKKSEATDLANELVRKWNCGTVYPPRPIQDYQSSDPSGYESYTDGFEDHAVRSFDIKDADKLAKQYTPITLLEKTSPASYAQLLIAAHKKGIKEKNRSEKKNSKLIEKVVPHYSYQSGQYLYVTIDLAAKKSLITKEIDSLVTCYRDYMPRDNKRNKPTTLDPWRVYDMQHKGLNFTQIARRLSGLKGNPAYNSALMTVHKQVKRAYDSACKMIDDVGKTAGA